MIPERVRCDDCFYGDEIAGGSGRHLCRRRAPVASDAWPVVEADDWCGEGVREYGDDGDRLHVGGGAELGEYRMWHHPDCPPENHD